MHSQISDAVMNFTPISAVPVPTQFSGNLTQNMTTADGHVVGVLQSVENEMRYIQPLVLSMFSTPAFVTLPITMSGVNPCGIQVLNPVTTIKAPTSSPPSLKYQISQMPIQTFGQGASVLAVAYNSSPDGIQVMNAQNLPEGMAFVSALQPADIQMLQHQSVVDKDMKDIQIAPDTIIKSENEDSMEGEMGNLPTPNYIQTTSNVHEYQALDLTQFLKFNTGIKREISDDVVAEVLVQPNEADPPSKKERKKYKNKPKPKKPKPGQVQITTASDGTRLFCCPECHMAYPEKEVLEDHLIEHNIRRFICGMCGAGLKRKEHLERHKLGHDAVRPFVCCVCMKGFKRKEHLNLHALIHSGLKTQLCDECGMGFYRKDHLMKHTQSHVRRRAKELRELLEDQQASP